MMFAEALGKRGPVTALATGSKVAKERLSDLLRFEVDITTRIQVL